jgi:hypothetical protein
VEPGSSRTKPHKPGRLTDSTFSSIEWLIANHGSITIGDVGMTANIGCVAAAADSHMCYAMLSRRQGEGLLDLMKRLDRAIASAAETSVTVDEVNPPGGFKPGTLKARRP